MSVDRTASGYISGVERPGWHLDDVPQPYLTVRRVGFWGLVCAFLAAIAAGLLLGMRAVGDRISFAVPGLLFGGAVVFGMVFGGFFAWTNKKSPRWREWNKTMPTMTPGWPDSGRPGV